MTYPDVMSEDETLDALLAGASIARFGDGEFSAARGANACGQKRDPELARRLLEILQDSGDCLVGIPNINAPTPKRAFWGKYPEKLAPLLKPGRRYASSFISRPDSAPWIDRPDYWARVLRLWAGRDVVLVRGTEKSLTAERLVGARSVREVIGPGENAWSEYGRLMQEVGAPELVVLCLGVTATVMAVDLCARGVQALDLGHLGMFLKRRMLQKAEE